MRVIGHKDDPEDIRMGFCFLLARSDMYVLMPSESTVFLFEPYGDARSMHVATVRHNRKVLSEGKEAVKWMFENVPDCKEIIGFVPEGRRDVTLFARRLCRAVGGVHANNIYRVRR